MEEGIEFKTCIEVGKDIEVKALEKEFDIILLCGGATLKRELPIKGSNLKGVVQAMDFLKHQNEVVDEISDMTVSRYKKAIITLKKGQNIDLTTGI